MLRLQDRHEYERLIMFHVHLTVLYFEVRRHFTPDKLFEDCAVGLGV